MGEEENIEKELKETLFKFESGLKTETSSFFTLKDILSVYDYYFFKGNNDKAIRALTIAKEQHPYSADPYVKEAELQLFFGNLEKAKSLIEKAKIFEPNGEEIFHLEVECLVQGKKIEEAITLLYSGLAHFENKTELFSYILEICESNHKYLEAIECLKKWAIEDEQSDFLHFEIARFYIKADKVNDGIKYFNSRINEDPYNSLLWAELGGLYEEQDDIPKAIWAFEYSTITSDNFYAGHLNLANCLLNIDELDKMKEQLDIANGIMPDSSELHLLYARYYKEKSNYTTAKKHLLKSIDLNDALPESWYEMGLTLKEMGSFSDALPYFKTAFNLLPTDEEYAIDYFHAENMVLGINSAIQVYEKAKLDQENNIEFFQTVALILCKEECFEKAAEVLLKDVESKSLLNAECFYILAAIQFELQNPSLGESYLLDGLSANYKQHGILFEASSLLEFDKKIQNTINIFRNE